MVKRWGKDPIPSMTNVFNVLPGDRTRMLAAITSLRLQVELMKDQKAKGKMVETLEDMQRMTEATMAFARDEASTEVSRSLDLSA